MNLLWALDWWWRLVVIWWGWAWLQQAATTWEESWTEAAGRVCLRLYKASVAMLSFRFLPFISSLSKPSENIQRTCATPPLPAASLEVEVMCTQVCTHTQKGKHTHTNTKLIGHKKVCHLKKDKFFRIGPESWLPVSIEMTKLFFLSLSNRFTKRKWQSGQ